MDELYNFIFIFCEYYKLNFISVDEFKCLKPILRCQRCFYLLLGSNREIRVLCHLILKCDRLKTPRKLKPIDVSKLNLKNVNI